MIKMQQINDNLALSAPNIVTAGENECTHVVTIFKGKIKIAERIANLRTGKIKCTDTYFDNMEDAEKVYSAI